MTTTITGTATTTEPTRALTPAPSGGLGFLLSAHGPVADRIVVLSQGSLVFEGGIADTRDQRSCLVRTPQLQRLLDALEGARVPSDPPDSAGRITVHAPAALVGRIAYDSRVLIEELVPGVARALESFYLSVTQGAFSAGGGRNAGE